MKTTCVKRILLMFLIFSQVNMALAYAPACNEVFEGPNSTSSKLNAALFWWATLAGTLLPYAALARGGFSGSGGGEGIATFNSPADADRARQLIASGHPLTPDLIAKAKIAVLENWEVNRNEAPLIERRDGATWQELLKTAKDNIRIVSPIFARRLSQTADWMQFSSWEDAPFIPALQDANPKSALPQNSVRLQLAVRLSAGNNPWGHGPTLNPLRLKVIFNKQVFGLLTPLDQAMLVLHEELYAMGQGVGHATSDQIRPIVQNFFRRDFATWIENSFHGTVMHKDLMDLQNKLVQVFGDYVLFFSNLPEENVTPQRSAARHFAVFLDLVRTIRQIKRCRSAVTSCERQVMEDVMNEMLTRVDLSDEQAFVFFAYFYLQQTVRVFNAESIMDTKRSPEDFSKAMLIACHFLTTRSPSLRDSPALSQALRYCQIIGK